ncbi:MAG: carbohydrate kinase [Bacteroidetes bacterium]|nr:carbohydrate kinase [Bacteroidota bacterium]
MNAALRLRSLDWSAGIISSVGKDEYGSGLKELMTGNGVDCSLLQEHPTLPTGVVHVALDRTGDPTYDIVSPSAWDHILAERTAIERVRDSACFLFGSLACRNDVSRTTLFTLLDHSPYKVFDVNLRPPFIALPVIMQLAARADLMKMNDEELRFLCAETGTTDIRRNIRTFAERTTAKIICVTKGKDGAVVYADGKFIEHPGFRVGVVDTVGAGDSFLAGFVSELLRGKPLSEALAFGCALGAMVAARKGANPVITSEQLNRFMIEHE